eukprot:scaffold8888_cov161-Amphora_coffeaeformis.AAC.4
MNEPYNFVKARSPLPPPEANLCQNNFPPGTWGGMPGHYVRPFLWETHQRYDARLSWAWITWRPINETDKGRVRVCVLYCCLAYVFPLIGGHGRDKQNLSRPSKNAKPFTTSFSLLWGDER